MTDFSTTTSKTLQLRLGSSGDLNNLLPGDIVLMGSPHRGHYGEFILRSFIVYLDEENMQHVLVDAPTKALVAASRAKYKAALDQLLWNDEDERRVKAL